MPDFWKFPGSQREGAGIDSTIEDMALWDERERIAKRFYKASVKHNDFAPWDSLSERNRKPWREMAYAEMQGHAAGVNETAHQPERKV